VDKEKVKCDICGKSFDSKKQLGQHTQDAHNAVDKSIITKHAKKSFKLSNKLIAIIGAGIIVVIIGSIGLYSAVAPHAPLPLTIGGAMHLNNFSFTYMRT
jgi:uncharacterized membrane protein YvbJ